MDDATFVGAVSGSELVSKQHAIVPHWFNESQAANPAILKKAYYVKKDELSKLLTQGAIRPFGTAGKLWQWANLSVTHDHKRVECGRISLQIPKRISDLMASEMALRPSWSLQEA